MGENTDWDSIEWLSSARKLVAWINQRPSSERIMLFLRHSHREIIEDHSKQFSTELTTIGKEMSFELGRKLPVENPAHLFFSLVPRCYQTAEEISKGFQENGGSVIDMDPLPVLVTPEISDAKVWENLQPDGKNITDFVNNWAEGNFGNMIEDFEQYKGRLLDDTIMKLKNAEEPVIHIHVTHDLALMAIKRTLLNRPVEYEDREPFLGGISTSIDQDGFHYQSF